MTTTATSNVPRGESRWRFPDNRHGEIRGFNDVGVRTFDANTISSVVRESIQNSLDAALDRTGTAPVRVEFELFSMDGADVPDSERLYVSLLACQDFCSSDRQADKFFSHAADHIEGRIPVLRISDHGTTGLRGAASGETSTDWSRLVKESGSSSKDDFLSDSTEKPDISVVDSTDGTALPLSPCHRSAQHLNDTTLHFHRTANLSAGI